MTVDGAIRKAELCPSAVVIYPAGDRWTLFSSKDVLEMSSALEASLCSASLQFGSAYAFATDRVIAYHHWAFARDGHLMRPFAYLGESGDILRDYGGLILAESLSVLANRTFFQRKALGCR